MQSPAGAGTTTSFTVDDVRLTRVMYFDIGLDPAVARLTTAKIREVEWASPAWATADGQLLVGQAAWVVESADRVLVIDPIGASDPFLRTGPDAVDHQEAVITAFASAGFPIERVDAVVLSHLDGIGMAALIAPDGAWAPLFPNARVVLTDVELEFVRSHPEVGGAEALLSLDEQGVVDSVPSGWVAAPDVTLEVCGGHSPGHALVRIGDGAVLLGHLAISPLNFSVPMAAEAHFDLPVAVAAVERELLAAASTGGLVIGPLWPAPGAAHVSGPPWVLTPA